MLLSQYFHTYSYLKLYQSKILSFGKELTLYQPNDKFFNTTKLKALADDKLNVAKMTTFLFDRAEKTVEKRENAGYQHFLLSPQCFPNLSSFGSLKVGIVCGKEFIKLQMSQALVKSGIGHFTTKPRLLPTLKKKPLYNLGKGENAGF